MIENQLLETTYTRANKLVTTKQMDYFGEVIMNDIDVLIAYIEKNKSIVSAVVTSLLKKVINPKQDIRLHRVDFKNGYSARSLDTKFVSPFFKKHFPKYANKESAF